jgi:hypothetical protein
MHPKAPRELSLFGFLIGEWKCKARFSDGSTLDATWIGRYILDGYAIADEYRMTDASGALIVLGMNFRSYDAAKQRWNMRWLHAFSGTWLDLVPEDLGGVTKDGDTITFVFRELEMGLEFTRVTFSNISDKHYTWRAEKSSDRESWSEFMVIEASR